MESIRRIGLVAGLVTAALLAAPAPLAGYVGPGATLAVIGAAIAVVGAVLVTVGGFVWYPVKRLWKALSRGTDDAAGTDDPAGADDGSPGDAA